MFGRLRRRRNNTRSRAAWLPPLNHDQTLTSPTTTANCQSHGLMGNTLPSNRQNLDPPCDISENQCLNLLKFKQTKLNMCYLLLFMCIKYCQNSWPQVFIGIMYGGFQLCQNTQMCKNYTLPILKIENLNHFVQDSVC